MAFLFLGLSAAFLGPTVERMEPPKSGMFSASFYCAGLAIAGVGFASIPAFIGDVFGTKRLSAIHGNILTAWAAAGLAGPLLAARVRETTGSYEQTLHIFAGLFVLALLCSILIQGNIGKIWRRDAARPAAPSVPLQGPLAAE